MRLLLFFLLVAHCSILLGQDYYEKARRCYGDGALDSARYYLNKNIVKKPTSQDYFLSGMLHEAEGKSLRALADYEAVVQKEPGNVEAYFQKGMIYYANGSLDQAIADFTFVIANHSGSETKAIYYGSEQFGSGGSFMTTLQSMLGKVHQYRGLAYQKSGNVDLALKDFSQALHIDTLAEVYINRSQLYVQMGQSIAAIADLKTALDREPRSYLAWYNLALLDQSVRLPEEILNDESFTPLLNLMGANAYETNDVAQAVAYYRRAIKSNENDDLAFLGRGKALLKMREFGKARQDFLEAMRINPSRSECLYLIGNSLFYEERFRDAIGFYDQYLSIDRSYANVWYNAAMSYFSINDDEQACVYLRQADKLGMKEATVILDRRCGSE